MLAEAYSKSITTSCLWVFCGRRRGEGALPEEGASGIRRRMLPYWVYLMLALRECEKEGRRG